MREAQIVETARTIVGRHRLPDFVAGFDVRIGDFDGDPAMWIVFKMLPGPERMGDEVTRRVHDISALKDAVRPALLEAFDDRFPYFRFEVDEEPGILRE